ncbi:GIY-YIG nuclease family protein [uncultured Brachyspira sp.]|uniref:GIY-YIG nuclease family protein n=1 Tax=uncultured Brachyspira sp. TaxID=221953 RepID=UPI0025F37B6B|nr:GIY-YIG nuclease family protein [uncultured Brachyspira sp.]
MTLQEAIQEINLLREKLDKALDENKMLKDKLDKALDENQKFREQLIDIQVENQMMKDNCDELDIQYSEIYQENKFLKQRVGDLEQSYDTINKELKRMKQKYEITSLETFMNLYGYVAERSDIKVIQEKYFEETGIKYSQAQLKRELEQIGYQVKHSGTKTTYHVSKSIKGFLYIVQLTKHKGTEIYKPGRTIYMKQRLITYKQHDGGAIEIICNPVNNQYKAEAKLLQLLSEAVDRNELKKNDYGDEYFEGPLDVIKKYYNQVIDEFRIE